MNGQIFISYRREDSAASAGRLFDRLSNYFPSNQIFMDVDSIDLGENFVKTIAGTVGSCDVLIAVIGKGWLTSRDQEGQRRLDNPDDFVRLEIATALKRNIRVIPVLVDGALMPQSRDLPDDLKTLVQRNALLLSHDRFRTDSERLVAAVKRALEQAAAERLEREPSAAVTPSPPAITTPSVEQKARSALERATKDHPWVNSLGMKFVPVAGTQMLFSVWDTRVQDFETFVKNTDYDATGGMYSLGKDGWKQRGATWKAPGFSQGANHPVVGVSWNDAKEFCQWLTKRERSEGDLPQDREYRLPTDEEWSAAVGLKNEVGNTPKEKSGKIVLYPWDIPQKRDKSWPPPSGAGNYCGGESRIGNEPIDWSVIEGYNDGYPRTSPVGSFEANSSGLHDMGGNVWQWCEDWYNAQQSQYRVLGGASWYDGNPGRLLASYRSRHTPVGRNVFIGFRCVVAVESVRLAFLGCKSRGGAERHLLNCSGLRT
jgi:formylglycine-generating enzyme required for sulfatase activity